MTDSDRLKDPRDVLRHCVRRLEAARSPVHAGAMVDLTDLRESSLGDSDRRRVGEYVRAAVEAYGWLTNSPTADSTLYALTPAGEIEAKRIASFERALKAAGPAARANVDDANARLRQSLERKNAELSHRGVPLSTITQQELTRLFDDELRMRRDACQAIVQQVARRLGRAPDDSERLALQELVKSLFDLLTWDLDHERDRINAGLKSYPHFQLPPLCLSDARTALLASVELLDTGDEPSMNVHHREGDKVVHVQGDVGAVVQGDRNEASVTMTIDRKGLAGTLNELAAALGPVAAADDAVRALAEELAELRATIAAGTVPRATASGLLLRLTAALQPLATVGGLAQAAQMAVPGLLQLIATATTLLSG